jgi:transcription factor TGA
MSNLELYLLVETGLGNYEHLFRIKAVAANGRVPRHIGHVEDSRRDVLFLWIGMFCSFLSDCTRNRYS